MTNYDTLRESLSAQDPGLLLKENEVLSKHTSFQIGGACPLMAFPQKDRQFLACLEFAREQQIPTVILGNGSNLLVADEGYDAFFIQTKGMNQARILLAPPDRDRLVLPQADGSDDDPLTRNDPSPLVPPYFSRKEVLIEVEVGCSLAKISNLALEHCLTGLEFAQGIPGTVGGAVMMNAGAYGGEMSQVVREVTSFSWDTGFVDTRAVEALDFSYRHSFFSDHKEVITFVQLALSPAPQAEIHEKMKSFAQQRKEKQPLNFPSCGSTFKRPEGHFAAALIDQCGFKGRQVGGAMVSPKHAGFVVNTGGATCQDVLDLVQIIKDKVWDCHQIALELEVKVLK